MALEYMKEEMLRQIVARGGKDAHQREYEELWDDAVIHSGKPLPCPKCYLGGGISRLKALEAEHVGIARVRCEGCSETFQFEDLD